MTVSQTTGDLIAVLDVANTTSAATTGTLVTNGLGGVDTITANALDNWYRKCYQWRRRRCHIHRRYDTITTGKVTATLGDGNDTLTVGYGTPQPA